MCGMVGGKREVNVDGRLVCAERGKERVGEGGKSNTTRKKKEGEVVVVRFPFPFLIPLGGGSGAYIKRGKRRDYSYVLLNYFSC